ncbi:MAG: tetratricopeptide repeat protein [Bacteroidales bacterium]|nr:tetratricopeptide repeat protein [Bacteroidales bacterium]
MSYFASKFQETSYKHSPVFLQVAILFFLAVTLYINTIGFDYTLDDTMVITENEYTTQGIEGIDEILTSDAMAGFLDNPEELLKGGRYRPLSMVMFAVEYEIWGRNPVAGHLINILLYALLAIVIFYLLRNLFKFQYQKPWYLTIPAVATALFIVHPIHTEAVANIKGRDEILAMLGAAVTLWLIIRYIDRKKIMYLLLAFPVFFLALMSKENAATMLAAVPLAVFVFRNEKKRQILVSLLPLFAGLLAYALLRYNALGFWTNEVENVLLLNDPFADATTTQKYATIFYTWAIYLKLLFFPHPLTHDYYPYHIELVDFSNPVVIGSVVFWVAVLIFALVTIRKKDIIAFSILYFLITFSVSSNLFFNVGTFMNERFMFMPSLAVAIIVAYFFNQTLRRVIRDRFYYKRIAIAIILALMLAGSVKTISRNMAWANDLTLFTTDVKTSSNSTKVNVSAGGKLREAAMKPENKTKRDSMLNLSEKYLKRALRIYPENMQGALLLGQNYLDRDMHEEAYKTYDYMLDKRPGHKKAYNNMHHLVQKTRKNKEFDLSVKAAQRLLQENPEDKDVLYDLAITYKKSDSIQKAIKTLNHVVKKDPASADAYFELGNLYGQHLGNMEKAKEYLMKAYEINPEDHNTVQNLGIVFAQEKEYQKAIRFFKKAIELNPNNLKAYGNLAVVYEKTGNREMARRYRNELKKRTQQ